MCGTAGQRCGIQGLTGSIALKQHARRGSSGYDLSENGGYGEEVPHASLPGIMDEITSDNAGVGGLGLLSLPGNRDLNASKETRWCLQCVSTSRCLPNDAINSVCSHHHQHAPSSTTQMLDFVARGTGNISICPGTTLPSRSSAIDPDQHVLSQYISVHPAREVIPIRQDHPVATEFLNRNVSGSFGSVAPMPLPSLAQLKLDSPGSATLCNLPRLGLMSSEDILSNGPVLNLLTRARLRPQR